jgi:transcriptional regulator with XRE-family HTH domain
MPLEHAADWSVVTGERFRERRIHLNLTQSELAEEAGIKSYETVAAVEKGKGSPSSRRRMDEALTRLEAEVGVQQEPEVAKVDQPHLIEFEVTGDFGVRVVVKGPVENAAELEASVARLIRDMKRQD